MSTAAPAPDKPKRTTKPKAEREPRQNHGAKLASLKQYLEIKIDVMTSLDSPAAVIAAYAEVLARINA